MTASTITFAVQIGSGGFEIARIVAERLGYQHYDWEVTSQAALEAGVSPEVVEAAERVPSLVERVLQRFLVSGAYAEDPITGHSSAAIMDSAIRALTSDQYRHFIERVVRGLAFRGEAVIVGHAGQVVLAQEPDVLRVLVCGSRKRRAGRLAAEAIAAGEKPEALVDQSDKQRLRFFKESYGVDLLSAALYDLTLNTDQLSLEGATGLVLAAAGALSPADSTPEPVSPSEPSLT